MKNKNKKQNSVLIGLFVVLFFAAVASFVSATGRLDIKVSTRSPATGQQFAVEATSLEFDTVRGNFKWYLNDKLISSDNLFASSSVACTVCPSCHKNSQVLKKSLVIVISALNTEFQ